MGNTESTDEFDEFAKFQDCDTLGYRVLGVQPNSPASQSGLVSFFDFLVGANGKILLGSGEDLQVGEEYDDVDFPALCQEFLHKPLELLVWNIKCQEKRLVTIVPSDSWGGAGLLGVTIRLDDYGGADERLIRVLEVEANSPAAIAGLVANHDYLLGTTAESFDSTHTLAQVLKQHVDKVVEVYVYNTDSDVVRVVALMPTWSWGGNGLLGAEVGTGYLHRLPMSSRDTIGSSVERKVRWVGMKPTHPTEESSNEQRPQGNAAAAVQPTLELEPQLEMEVMDSSEAPHDTHKTVQQVADHDKTVPIRPTINRSDGQVEPNRVIGRGDVVVGTAESSSECENGRRSVPPGPAAASVSSSADPEPPGESAEESGHDPALEGSNDQATTGKGQQEAEPSAQGSLGMVSTRMPSPPPPGDAASLFSAPPPDAHAPTSFASQMMPPPPMSSLSRKEDGVDLR